MIGLTLLARSYWPWMLFMQVLDDCHNCMSGNSKLYMSRLDASWLLV